MCGKAYLEYTEKRCIEQITPFICTLVLVAATPIISALGEEEMQHVIDGVAYYPGIVDRSKYGICMASFMNILAFHSSVFKNDRIFDLLRAKWSFWYFQDQVGHFSTSYIRQEFLLNLKFLFNTDHQTIICRTPDQLRQALANRICSNRPVFLSVDGTPAIDGKRIRFIEGVLDHLTFTGYGYDRKQDHVLLLNNSAKFCGWVSVGDIAARLKDKRVSDIIVPEKCEFPTKTMIAKLLLLKINPNFEDSGAVAKAKRYGQGLARRARYFLNSRSEYTGRSLIPSRVICGWRGIRSLARHFESFGGEFNGHVQAQAKQACQKIMGVKQEREIFISVVKNFLEEQPPTAEFQNIEMAHEALQDAWKDVARLFARIYMTDMKPAPLDISQSLYALADQEERFLLKMKNYLTAVMNAPE